MANDLALLPLRPRSALHAYQERGARWITDHPAAGLFMDVGLGKTATALTAIVDLQARGEAKHVLVVGPPRVVLTVWTKEAASWRHAAGLRVMALSGTPDQRRERLKNELPDTDIVCVSFAMLGWLHQTVKRETWDMVIIDESSQIKNSTTKRWKACAYTALTAKRRVVLTGTPRPKGLADLWGQVSVCDLGARFGRNRSQFLRRYFQKTEEGWELREGAGKQIMAKLKDFAIAMQAKDYLELPSLIENRIAVGMPSTAWDLYNELAERFAATLESGAEIDVANAGVMVGKLQQIAQGAMFTEGSKSWETVHSAKIDAVVDLVSELNTEPTIIAYWYRFDLERLRTAFPEAPVLGSSMSAKRLEQLIDRWNRGEIPILLLHPASAGHGLNLQAGGRHLIWSAIPWSWELYHQTVARIYRQGQSKPVMVHRIVAAGTIDDRILEVLAQRQGGHEALVGALKADAAVAKGCSRIKEARSAMQRAHPDRGGSPEAFIAARREYERARQEERA